MTMSPRAITWPNGAKADSVSGSARTVWVEAIGVVCTVPDYDARVATLGLVLPGPHPPHDPLDAVVVHGGVARTSGQLPRIDGRLTCTGRLGDDVSVAEG